MDLISQNLTHDNGYKRKNKRLQVSIVKTLATLKNLKNKTMPKYGKPCTQKVKTSTKPKTKKKY